VVLPSRNSKIQFSNTKNADHQKQTKKALDLSATARNLGLRENLPDSRLKKNEQNPGQKSMVNG
jgi:hypothetical protein